MLVTNLLIIGILILILGLAGLYVYRAKRKGIKCIGCPNGATCSGSCHNCPGCSHK